MKSVCCVRDLADEDLIEGLAAAVTRSRAADAGVLAYLAEVDERKLYLPAACASMRVYCVRVLHMSEDAAFRRITAARVARRFPAIFAAVADGRLHVSAVIMLSPMLTDENADALIASASHRTKREIERIIAEWAPRPDVPALVEPLPCPLPAFAADELVPERVAHSPDPEVTTRTTPLAPQRYALQVTIDQETQEKLEQAQALMRHRVRSGDLAQVIDHALDALLVRLRKEKFAVTDRPRRCRRSSENGEPSGAAAGPQVQAEERPPGEATRHVPAEVRRTVHERDGEQCSFVSAEGVRCTERGFLELDHVEAFAVGGPSTVPNTRVLCRGHNGHAADLRFGRAFMDAHRRRGSARRRQAADGAASTAGAPTPSAEAPAPDLTAEVMLALRGLDVKPADARDAIDRSAHLPATSLPERLRAALQALRVTYASRSSEPAPVWSGDPRAGGTATEEPSGLHSTCARSWTRSSAELRRFYRLGLAGKLAHIDKAA